MNNEELSYEDIKKLCKDMMVNDIIMLLHKMKSKKKGSRRSKNEVIRLAELSYEIVRSLEEARRYVIISNSRGIKEIIIRVEVIDY